MTPMDTTTARFDVRSADGTTIAVWVGGDGPALVMVHGSLQDHTVSAALVGELHAGLTTYAMDRRGFGASGDHEAYSLEREFEDVASVVDEVAARRVDRSPCGDTRTAPTAPWAPPISPPTSVTSFSTSPASASAIHRAGSRRTRRWWPWVTVEGAIVLMFRDLLEFNDQQIDAMRAGPEWPGRIAVAHTLAREARAEEGWDYQPGQFDRIITPTLLIAGSDSTAEIRLATDAAAAAIAGARIHLLAGHAHVAHRTHPALIAKIVRDFIAD